MILNVNSKIQNYSNSIQISKPQRVNQVSYSAINKDTVSFSGKAEGQGNFIQRMAKRCLDKLKAKNDAVPHNVLVFSGPSGGGKDTIVLDVKKKFEKDGYELASPVSDTTRSPRPGEIDGVHYNFITPEKFAQKDARGEYFEQNLIKKEIKNVDGSVSVIEIRYGGALAETESKRMGHDAVKIISADAAPKLKKQFGKDAVLIYINAPSEEEVKRRLIKRGTETAESIAARLEYNKMQARYIDQFDAVIMNDNLEIASEELFRYIKSSQSEEVKALKLVKLAIKFLSKIAK